LRYYIIGYKSSGKTTLGKAFAERLKLPFVDTDLFMEEQFSKSIPALYSEVGEVNFRKLEWKALKSIIMQFPDAVISTGGGTPCHCDNMSLMKESGKLIYLRVSTTELTKRLQQAVLQNRPIVKGKNRDELYAYLMKLRSECEQHYLLADFIVEGDNLHVEDIWQAMSLDTTL
jgi:shikimate kinase